MYQQYKDNNSLVFVSIIASFETSRIEKNSQIDSMRFSNNDELFFSCFMLIDNNSNQLDMNMLKKYFFGFVICSCIYSINSGGIL